MNKQAFHVVLTTHNSRTSQRMIDYNVKKGPALELNLEQEITVTKIISSIINENKYKCIAYNICMDHVHLILVCEYGSLSNIIKIIKGKSSYLFKRTEGNDWITKLWSLKFYRANLNVWTISSVSQQPGYLYKDTHLDRAIDYIINNRKKHKLPKSETLTEIIKSFVVSQEKAFGD